MRGIGARLRSSGGCGELLDADWRNLSGTFAGGCAPFLGCRECEAAAAQPSSPRRGRRRLCEATTPPSYSPAEFSPIFSIFPLHLQRLGRPIGLLVSRHFCLQVCHSDRLLLFAQVKRGGRRVTGIPIRFVNFIRGWQYTILCYSMFATDKNLLC